MGDARIDATQKVMIVQIPSEANAERLINERVNEANTDGWQIVQMMDHNGFLVLLLRDAVSASECGDREDRLENALRLLSEQRDAARSECEKLKAALRDVLDNCPTFVTAGGVPVPVMVTPAAIESAERARALVGSAPQTAIDERGIIEEEVAGATRQRPPACPTPDERYRDGEA